MVDIRYLVVSAGGEVTEAGAAPDALFDGVRGAIGCAELKAVYLDNDLEMYVCQDEHDHPPNLFAAVVLTVSWGRAPRVPGTAVFVGGRDGADGHLSLTDEAAKFVRDMVRCATVRNR